MSSKSYCFFAAVFAAFFLVACAETPQPTEIRLTHPGAAVASETQTTARQVVVFHAEQDIPADCGRPVERLGGALEASLDNIGVASFRCIPTSVLHR